MFLLEGLKLGKARSQLAFWNPASLVSVSCSLGKGKGEKNKKNFINRVEMLTPTIHL